ncbi:hypothetical protein AKJ64_02440 [candidate division MSBL1 archaeon SCGC-AAA259E17]|uniref:Uroporphyrinogen decarboxylase (URO-D) domain-containing protein n=1 Tax=candidate division MSBL1 archaeon SCGC-AAA259E17 TaxID=1698263 RepID=A0A133UEV6_9EURY|nr:hypothetical protein AKJ64_02440 [candidate division MSBL1 archaeon SCGC-AAA259E17]
MNQRKRVIETLTFGDPDRVPLWFWGDPRPPTLEYWHQTGLPKNVYWKKHLFETLGIEKNMVRGEASIGIEQGNLGWIDPGVSFNMIPKFEEKILEQKSGHYIVRNWQGQIVEIDKEDWKYIQDGPEVGFTTRKWHKFPVEKREDWEKIKEKYDPYDERRYPDNFDKKCQILKDIEVPVAFNFPGPFWKIRDWVGFERICRMFRKEPDFLKDMIDFWTNFISKTMANFLEETKVDRVQINEDMAFKKHSMISPKMVRKFLKPSYEKWVKEIKKTGCPIVEIDSDGYIGNLIPIWIDSGINSTFPVEVAAGNDIVEYREMYGKKMAYQGGIDKRAIAKGGKTMKKEVMRVVPPLLEKGGYIPGIDHAIPSDVSWHNFVEYIELLAKLTGWL